MKIRALVSLLALAVVATTLSIAKAAPQAPSPPAPASNSPQAAPSGPQLQYFFTATDSAFEAYYDPNAVKLDADSNKQVTVKLMKFSAAFRAWIKSNFPGGEVANYALDDYSVDCGTKQVAEHQITWYDASGTELTNYDFGGTMSAPITYSMKDNLMRKLCGLP